MTESMHVEFVGELSRVAPKPGEAFILHCAKPPTADQKLAIERAWAQLWEHAGVQPVPPVLMVPRGMTLAHLVPPPTEPAA
jgi:hypothetical protein